MKRLVKSVIAGTTVCLLAMSVFANGNKDTAGSSAAASGSTDKYAFVFKSTGNPYGERMMDGFKTALEEQGYESILRAPEQPTAEGQIQIIEQLITQRVKAICVSANDNDALQPVLTKAMKAGIKTSAVDSNVNAASRMVFVNQADSEKIGRTLIQAAYDMTGGKGDIAVLSATSQATNQNLWIDWMKKELAENASKYANLKLVKIAYGDDLRDKSTTETEGLLRSFPDLKCIIAPTTVGIAAASKVVADKGLTGKVFVTGLGLPSEMAEAISTGVCPYMFLWNPVDEGYLAGYVNVALAKGTVTGKVGDKFSAGRLGDYTVTQAADGGTEVLLGPPFKFDKTNIDKWKTVY
jgi:rhamnose transport system substrate-binding protein